MDINEEAYAIQEEVVEFRRALHRCPEIAFHETMTMEYIREHLEEWEIYIRFLIHQESLQLLAMARKKRSH